jgi:hypothetical protein
MAFKVIGAGQSRTGTLSLKFALEHLGFGPCCHAAELLSRLTEQFPLWMSVVQGAPDWDAVFEGFSSTVDFPTNKYWRELAAYYPDSKVILSTRDAESWFDSLQRSVLSPEARDKSTQSPMIPMITQMLLDYPAERFEDREFMLDHFRCWNAEVISILPPERLLVWQLGDGWEPLCAFLDVPVPAEPYPHINSGDDILAAILEGDNSSPEQIAAGARSYIDEMRAKAFPG